MAMEGGTRGCQNSRLRIGRLAAMRFLNRSRGSNKHLPLPYQLC